MSKRGIILIIILLVVVNISTYCGYGRMNRAIRDKKEIVTEEVDSIRILRLIPVPGNPAKYPWKRLSRQQIGDFVSEWKHFQGCMASKFEPAYEIEIYYNYKSSRKLWALENDIREGRLYYYYHALSKNYFEDLYTNAENE